MSHRTLTSISSLVLVLTAGCTLPTPPQDEGASTDPTAPADPQASECTQQRADVEGLLRERCAACHDNGSNQGSLGGITDLDGLIAEDRIIVGDAEGSPIYLKVADDEMPLGGPPLSADEKDTLQNWIDVCTLADVNTSDASLREPPRCLENTITPASDVLAAIRQDVAGLDPVRARTTRYFVLSHLYSAGFCEEQVEGYRHALAKLLNHLSFSPQIHLPEAIDAARTIFRIDLTHYDWDQDTWALITATDPYAVLFQSEDARVIQTLSEVQLFSVKGDWFIEAASQPPLYYDILKIPATRFELEAQLGVDVLANIADEITTDDDDVLRAGFQNSKVSDFNRAIERHQLPSSPDRAYWLSYDFGSNDAQKSLLENPLDFVADGGEIIFHLPNGLQGYMLVGSQGERIDTGPPNIVHDSETIEEPIVINGLSCMSCHSEGMRKVVDEVGPFAAGNPIFGDVTREQIAKIYAPLDVFERALDQDIQNFADAMSKTGAPLRVGDNEPVMAAHLAFEEPVSLRRAAAEFGIAETDLLPNVGKLRELNILNRAPVDRAVFEANFAFNACALNLGITTACPQDPVEQ